MRLLETERLILRYFCLSDAEFIIQLLNEPSFIEYVGDKGDSTVEEANQYLVDGPLHSYERFGYGLNLVSCPASILPNSARLFAAGGVAAPRNSGAITRRHVLPATIIRGRFSQSIYGTGHQ